MELLIRQEQNSKASSFFGEDKSRKTLTISGTRRVESENTGMRQEAPEKRQDLVSVVIPTHNYGHYISEAIESLLNQSYSNLEIIVVDDGSTDNTRAIVKKYPGVKYIYQDHLGQPSAARALNKGISVCKGKYIAAMGADDQLSQSYIEECINLLRKDQKIGMVWTGSLLFGDDVDRFKSKFFSPLVKTPHTRFSFYAMPGGPIGAALVPRRVYDDVGPYDENLASLEDWDFVIRVLHHKWRARSIDKPLYKYRKHRIDRAAQADQIWELGLRQLYKKYLFMFPYRTFHYFYSRASIFLLHPTVVALAIRKRLS